MTTKQAKPTCTITLKNWQGYKRMTIRGEPLQMDIETPMAKDLLWDNYLPYMRRMPTKVSTTFVLGTEKARMWS